MQLIQLVSVVLLLGLSSAVDNGVGRTPGMGYNTWNDFRCDISEADIIDATDAIIREGLDKVGYKYVNMDDCWAKGRNSDGSVYPDPAKFPNGIKHIADYVHSKGLKFGIYTDRGDKTCAGRPGSQGYEKIDAKTYAEWGVDYLKEDSCNASQDHNTAFQQYATMRDALNATGRQIYFSLCGWNTWYSPVGWSLGNSWRIADDCNTWENVLNAIDSNVPLTDNARPGGWNDPDMLLGSSAGSAVKITQIQSRAMFSLWSVMAAPLLIGGNIRNLSAWDFETYSNPEVIEVDQDIAGIQGSRVAGGNLKNGSPVSTFNVWSKKLHDGSHAVFFINNDNKPADVSCDSACFQKIGISSSSKIVVRDLWKKTNIGTFPATTYTVKNLAPEGGHALYKFTTQ